MMRSIRTLFAGAGVAVTAAVLLAGCAAGGAGGPAGADARSAAAGTVPSSAVFDPLPEAAPAPAGATPLSPRLTAPLLGTGAVHDLDVTTVVDVIVSDARQARDALDLMSPSMTLRTVGRVSGRLEVIAADGAGRLASGRFRAASAVLVRDGAVIARLDPGTTVTIDGGTITIDGSPVAAEIRQLISTGVLAPLAPIDWATLADMNESRRVGATWTSSADAAREAIRVPDPVAAGAVRGVAIAFPTGDLLAVRAIAESADDARISRAFPSAVPGSMRMGALIRRRIEPAALPTVEQASMHVTRFGLADARGTIDGERSERITLRLVERRPPNP